MMIKKLKEKSIYSLFFMAIISHTTLSLVLNFIDYYLIKSDAFNDDIFKDFMNENLIIYILLTLFLVPLLETLIFQTIVIEIILKINNKASILSIIISAFIFGLIHNYNAYYQFSAFLIGLFYAWIYLFIKKNKKESAFLFLVLIHSTNNLIATLFDIINP